MRVKRASEHYRINYKLALSSYIQNVVNEAGAFQVSCEALI